MPQRTRVSIFHEPCIDWDGDPRHYQVRAADAMTDVGREPTHWAWITPLCGNSLCIEPQHLAAQSAVKIAYPYGICIYCGRHAHTKDHLLPRSWSGDAARHFVVTVPACGTCNSLLNDTLTWSITERRAICRERLRRHYGKLLRVVDRTDEELDEYGPTLRAVIVDGMSKKRELLKMLSWPDDPAYDLRALEQSGVQDGYAIGLLIAEDEELIRHAKEAA